MKYSDIREEELKIKVGQDIFWQFDCSKRIGNVDFCVTLKEGENQQLFETQSLLWAEAKTGSSDVYLSFVQLILTIGKERTFDSNLPPSLLAAFDGEKIAFLPYSEVTDIFYQNDFNWNVTPSDHSTKEFRQIYERAKAVIDAESLVFDYEKDEKVLVKFIRRNLAEGKHGLTKVKIDKNNFMIIYNRWRDTVMPSINMDWVLAKKSGLIDGDFYLADVLSENNMTLKDKLYVLLKSDKYEFNRRLNDTGFIDTSSTGFKDGQIKHNQFWNRYERPPKEEYWEYIVTRRDLLVPQDVRERKGSFYTPKQWVELSQQYLADALGENWQEDYYIWDCAAGTGNLLAGLTNKYNIWASTLDKQDVEVMKDRIKNGANLLESHVFQFDFLNDDFDKLPAGLQEIVNDPEKRKKLVMYINPPYAEVARNETSKANRINKRGISFTKVQEDYSEDIGIATKELSSQFQIRIYKEISDCLLAIFSKVKFVQGPNFNKFRNHFFGQCIGSFTAISNSFDNVKGNFPISFSIWNLSVKEDIKYLKSDIISNTPIIHKEKVFFAYQNLKYITDWFRKYHNRQLKDNTIGAIGLYGSDFQHSNFIRITNTTSHPNRYTFITKENLITSIIYLTVRHCIEATWLNDRDQFLHPNDGWKDDKDFQSDCLAFTLFHGQNRITSKEGTNHWIPFTEKEVDAKDKYESHFMIDFIAGKYKREDKKPAAVKEPEDAYKAGKLFLEKKEKEVFLPEGPIIFTESAIAVFDAGRELWRYYHSQPGANPNAAFYDIREHFQGRNAKGRMNPRSDDERYTELIKTLRVELKTLAKKIEPKVYEYGFLKR